MAQCVLRIQSRHVLIISLNKVNFPFLLIQTGARKDPSICEKTHEARDAKKQKKKKKGYDNPLVLYFEAPVSHNFVTSQFTASIMGRCLPTVKQLLAKAAIKVRSGNVSNLHVSASNRIPANGRCVTLLSSCDTLPQSTDPHILRLHTGLAADFLKISRVPSLSF